MNNHDDILVIEKYFDNELSEAEQQAFEKRLKSDMAFQELYEQEKLLIEGIRQAGRKKALENLKTLEKNLPDVELEQGKIIDLKKYRFWAIAAGFLLILGSVALFYLVNSQPTYQQVYAEFYEPYPNLLNTVTRGEEQQFSLKEQGLQAYEAGNYSEAINLLEQAYEEEPIPLIRFYAGSSYLANGDADRAIAAFEDYIQSGGELQNQARWYLGLSHLQKGEVEKAETYFNTLANESHVYAEKSKEILNKIR